MGIASNTKSMFTSSSSLSSSYSFPLLVLAAAVVAVVVTSSSSSNTVYVAAVNIAAVEEAAKTNPAFGRSVEHHRQMVASLDLDPHERRALQGGGKNADKPAMDFLIPARTGVTIRTDQPRIDRSWTNASSGGFPTVTTMKIFVTIANRVGIISTKTIISINFTSNTIGSFVIPELGAGVRRALPAGIANPNNGVY